MRLLTSRFALTLILFGSFNFSLAAGSGPKQFWAPTVATKIVQPEYPLAARLRHEEGDGMIEAKVDFQTGRVTSVWMFKSTGHKLLDDAALAAFRQWRFRPGVLRAFRSPIHYRMGS
ncbi:MAG: energy transducer TonB [Chthoniobacterales bacterium]